MANQKAACLLAAWQREGECGMETVVNAEVAGRTTRAEYVQSSGCCWLLKSVTNIHSEHSVLLMWVSSRVVVQSSEFNSGFRTALYKKYSIIISVVVLAILGVC